MFNNALYVKSLYIYKFHNNVFNCLIMFNFLYILLLFLNFNINLINEIMKSLNVIII